MSQGAVIATRIVDAVQQHIGERLRRSLYRPMRPLPPPGRIYASDVFHIAMRPDLRRALFEHIVNGPTSDPEVALVYFPWMPVSVRGVATVEDPELKADFEIRPGFAFTPVDGVGTVSASQG